MEEKNLFGAIDKINKKYSDDIATFCLYITGSLNTEHVNMKKIIKNLDNPVSLSQIYDFMLQDPYSWGEKNLDLIKKFSSDFYHKVLFLHKVAYSNKNYIDNEIKEYIKDEKETYYKPFQDEFSKNIKSINERINSNKDSIESLIKEINERDEIIENKIRKNVYSEFITILGIFTAITFAIFGGINTINSISSNLHISSSNPQNLGNLLIGTSVSGIVLFGIITVLFAGIAKITEKDYNLPPLLTISVLAIISAMFMIGLVFTFLADNWNLSIWPQIIISVVVIAVIIAVAIFIKCKSNKFKKS